VKGAARPGEAEARLAALEARIAQARAIEPTAEERHCRDCFERGRNAALRVIDGG
jgi:hypothetical protein